MSISTIPYCSYCLHKENQYKLESRVFIFLFLIRSGREIPMITEWKDPGSLKRYLYGRARLTRFVFPASLLYRTQEKLQKPTFSFLMNFSERICTKWFLFEYSKAKIKLHYCSTWLQCYHYYSQMIISNFVYQALILA